MQPNEIRRDYSTSYTLDGNTLRGYAVVYNSPSRPITEGGKRFIEVVRPGAFSRSLSGDIVSYFNHNPNRILGRTSAGTLRLFEDSTGVGYELDLPNHAADVKEMVQRGDVTGSSFHALVLNDEWQGSKRFINDVSLFEVGPVTKPAYPATTAAMRSMEAMDLYEKKLKLLRIDIFNNSHHKRGI